ncbi:heterokaryon incompatibility protein-domain-containing protein [Boeremia exigua]|uniref:heterokaryon incompatibility protein-domain-containing protein n=1 Tax=Boeremia exigua TaxID=749465 RepID=UPI001E8D09A9|nr:heterokaryon incompatibility protein-domain-containing protein [Boeremia exigua]KAH6642715.1 heterokaryon incompatibility protein-domain-containing protein [Boeremia exigua]
MPNANAKALIPLQRQEGALCKQCSQIPWERLVDDEALEFLNLEAGQRKQKRLSCRICRMLEQGLAQGLYTPTYLSFWYSEKYLHFEDSLSLESRYVCSIDQDRHPRYNPHILTTRLSPRKFQHALQHKFPQQVDVAKLRTWIGDCENFHDQYCTPSQLPDLVGMKIIDCERQVVVDVPRDCKFVALSYVWGDQFSQSKSSFGPQAKLPKTIQDSIQLTQQLGLRYLWIDRYCIDQDNAREKYIQIAQMGHIYSAAYLTIVAAAGTGSDHGLPGVTPNSRAAIDYVAVGSVYLYTIPRFYALFDVNRTLWSSRAWTLQEGIMSKRRLIFTEHQVIYVCGTSTQYEAPMPPKNDRYYVTKGREHNIEDWLTRRSLQHDKRTDEGQLLQAMVFLADYSSRTLSYDTDALNAIVGVLNTLSTDNVYHICGVPVHLPTSTSTSKSPRRMCNKEPCGKIALFWYHLEPARRRDGFSSWSSVAWDGSIDWLDSRHREHTLDARHVRVLSKSGKHDLRTYILSTTSLEPVQLLECDAQAIEFKLSDGSSLDWAPGNYSSVCVVMALDSAHSIVLLPLWDICYDIKDMSPVIGVFPSAKAIDDASSELEGCILLRAQGEHYERVGFVLLMDIFAKANINPRFDYRFFRIVDNDMQIVSERDHKDLAHRLADPDGRSWWERYAKKKTILWG